MDNRIRSISISSLNHEHEDSVPIEAAKSPSWLLSELLQNFSAKEKDNPEQYNQIIIDNSNKLVALLAQYPAMKGDLMLQTIINKISFMFYSNVAQIRASSYKILKNCVVNEDSLYILVQNRVLIYLIITLSSDSSSDLEKSYAVKLIQKFLVVENGSSYLSMGIVKALIHLLDEDLFVVNNDLKHLIMEILIELAILNPRLIYHSNAFNLLVRSLTSNSNIVILMHCLFALLKLLDTDDSRLFFRNGYNLNSLISVFDEESLVETTKQKLQKFQRISFLLTVFLKNWNGLISCSLNDFRILGDLINKLDGDDTKLKEFILDILLDVLGIKSLPWLRGSVIGDYLLKFNPDAKFIFETAPTDEDNEGYQFISHYLHHYTGILTFIFVKLDLINLLVKNVDTSLNDKVILLLSHLYKFSKIYLPAELGLDLSDNINLHSLIKISNYNLKTDYKPRKVPSQIDFVSNAGTNLDDTEFKGLINSTKVLTVKEFNNWDWKLIHTVLQATSVKEKRFIEVLEKQPKFFKRLLSFYRPFKFRFCNLSNKLKDHKRILQVGLLIFEIFIKYQSGLKYLFKNKILIQMSEIFAQVDPFSGVKAKNPILCERNLLHTMNYGYLKFVGKLSESDNGNKLLNQWQFYQIIDNIIEGSEASKVNNVFLLTLFRALKFEHHHTNTLLFKAMAVSNLSLKLKVIDNLHVFKLDKMTAIKLIIYSLYQPELSEKLVDYLYDYYADDGDSLTLQLILKFNPPISILSKYAKGCNLLNKFMSTSEGYNYLSRFLYVDSHFKEWLENKKNLQIVKFYEYRLSKRLFPYFKAQDPIKYTFFLKSLLDTKEGLGYFQSYNLETNFTLQLELCIKSQVTRIIKADTLTDLELLELKQDLWILGEIISSNFGIQVITFEFFEFLIGFFYECPNWTIKSLIFYQIGKLSLSNEGIEVLDENDWVSSFNKFNKFENFGYPKNLDLSFFGNIFSSINFHKFDRVQFHSFDDLNEHEQLIMELIFKFPSNLTKLDKQPSKELMYLKKNHPYLFSYELFLKMIKFIDNSNFNFTKRDFIFGLFVKDTNLLELLSKRKK